MLRWILRIPLVVSALASQAQTPEGTLDRRINATSNFEFALFSNGLLWGFGDHPSPWRPSIAHWPRGSFHMWTFQGGFAFLAIKEGRHLVAEIGVTNRWVRFDAELGFFHDFVPGRVGDPHAGYDSTFGGAGWRYVDDPDYRVYSSLDYDQTGVDVSGSNANDWPVRRVGGFGVYVPRVSDRQRYLPAYYSDEDMFTVFKDTDTRADWAYTGIDGKSIPIGIEVQHTIYSWGEPPLSDVIVLQYDVVNKSGFYLDSCHMLFKPGLSIVGRHFPIPQRVWVDSVQPWRNLVYQMVPVPGQPYGGWRATAFPPTLGYPILETPYGYDGAPAGMKFGVCAEKISWIDSAGVLRLVNLSSNSQIDRAHDSLIYRTFTMLGPEPPYPSLCETSGSPAILTNAFPMSVDGAGRITYAIIFADSLPHLRLLDDLIKRMHANDYQRPSAPPAPQLTAKGLNRAVKLTWDTRAEQSEDIIIPDSLGRPFVGYRLLRAAREEGPYTELARWHVDSALVHEYIDRGEDIGGLKNNVRYYYRLLSFDEGAPRLKLEPMESKPEKGVNWQSVVPGTDAANTTAIESSGLVVTGTLGGVWLPRLMPENTTNFTSYFSGRTITMRLQTSTDGTRYTLPVTIRDTVAGREQFAILDPGLMVHGHPGIAGIKEGVLHVPDIFGIGGARIEVPYRYEQLPDSFRVGTPVIEGQADVPILTTDSLNVTGIQTINPYFESGRGIIVHFEPGGVDTLSLLFGVILPYLNVRITDAETGEEYERNRDWTLRVYAVRSTGGGMTTTVRNRYYLTGTAPNGHIVDAGHLLTIHNTTIAFDFPDRGQGSGKPAALFPWGSGHRSGTRDFAAGERVRIGWEGGVRGGFPDAKIHLTGAPAQLTDVTEEMMESIRVVPNPYLIRHEAQRGEPRIYFNYLPDECTIRIYTIALDLVKTLHHSGGSRVEWDLMTEGGQLVASQMLIAHIEAPNGKSTTKKFSVVVGR